MNLKLVVASMSVLGLVSCPVFAACHTKHKHHHHKKHVVCSHRDYKDTGAMPVQAVEPAPMVSPVPSVMESVTQNVGRAMPMPEWFNRIGVSGGMNIDGGKWGNRNANYEGENYQRVSLNDAYLNITGNVNDWTKVFTSLSYSNPSFSNLPVPFPQYSNVYDTDFTVEQAFVTLGNFDCSPLYVQLGKQFQDFSRYEIHPITVPLTQVLSETLATSAKIGFVAPMGFNGSIFAFDNPLTKVGHTATTTNYGASLGFQQVNDSLGWDLGAAYMYDMIGANDVAAAVSSYNFNVSTPGTSGIYHSNVGAAAVYADVNSGPFYIGARYTSALQSFSATDLPTNGLFTTATASTASGARPWAAGIQAGYGFDAWSRDNNIYIGYQVSKQSVMLGIPESRWLLGYAVDVWKNTSIGAEWDHDNAYSTSTGGNGNNSNLVSLRAAVKFG